MVTDIILGVFMFSILCSIAFIVYNKWNEFKNLQVGDSCGRFVECDSTSSKIIMDDIIKVDTDYNGYTIKVYTKNGAYTFLDFMKNNIMIIYD
jgi:uncharacterized protein YxeA